MASYYNDNDPHVCEWLRNLIGAGLIPPGDVDERSITEVEADDLDGYTQCHFFCGIAGWPLALEYAGWDRDRPVWTGSCPCQPFSSAGRGLGASDERHLWPEFYRLIGECRPATVFGEQVASKAGRGWFAGVRADLEALGYAVGGADLCAAGVGAPHIRQRLWWLGESTGLRYREEQVEGCDSEGEATGWQQEPGGRCSSSDAGTWDEFIFHDCADGVRRRIPVEPAFFPVAPRLPGHAVVLHGAGNAIVPQVAAEFISAYMEIS